MSVRTPFDGESGRFFSFGIAVSELTIIRFCCCLINFIHAANPPAPHRNRSAACQQIRQFIIWPCSCPVLLEIRTSTHKELSIINVDVRHPFQYLYHVWRNVWPFSLTCSMMMNLYMTFTEGTLETPSICLCNQFCTLYRVWGLCLHYPSAIEAFGWLQSILSNSRQSPSANIRWISLKREGPLGARSSERNPLVPSS